MSEPYMIEIYPPGGTETPLAYFESPRPFLAIHQGDLIHPVGHDFQHTAPGDPLHRVTAVVHLIWGDKHSPNHKIMVYTEAVPDDDRALFPASEARPVRKARSAAPKRGSRRR